MFLHHCYTQITCIQYDTNITPILHPYYNISTPILRTYNIHITPILHFYYIDITISLDPCYTLTQAVKWLWPQDTETIYSKG